MRARFPLAAIALLAAATPGLAAAGVLGQGGVRMGADALWSRGVLGDGQVVAVLDEGFAGLDRAIALGELPAREVMEIRSFDPVHGLDGRTPIGLPTQHGVRMAELIHDIAPRARLVLVQYRTVEQFAQAASWIAAAGIPVASHSNSFLVPPYDGSGPSARAVDAAAAAGVLWVNSAGNYAQRHWAGQAPPGAPAVLPIAPAAGAPLLFSLSWPAGGPSAALSVERRDPATGAWAVARTSAPAGPGNATTEPLIADAAAWRVVVTQAAGPPAPLRLFSQTVGFGPLAVAAGSVPTPGDAAGSLTVGAVRWTGVGIEPYSSVGDGVGSRSPDLVGPTYVTSNPEWPGTAGTSAAAAHVAGAALLLRAARLRAGLPAGVAELRAALLSTALDLGAPGVDPVYGAGMARLDARPPRLSVRVTAGERRVVRVAARDEGTIRRVRVELDGRALRTARRSAVGVRLPALSRDTHRLTVTAVDMAGNVAARTRVLRGRA